MKYNMLNLTRRGTTDDYILHRPLYQDVRLFTDYMTYYSQPSRSCESINSKGRLSLRTISLATGIVEPLNNVKYSTYIG